VGNEATIATVTRMAKAATSSSASVDLAGIISPASTAANTDPRANLAHGIYIGEATRYWGKMARMGRREACRLADSRSSHTARGKQRRRRLPMMTKSQGYSKWQPWLYRALEFPHRVVFPLPNSSDVPA